MWMRTEDNTLLNSDFIIDITYTKDDKFYFVIGETINKKFLIASFDNPKGCCEFIELLLELLSPEKDADSLIDFMTPIKESYEGIKKYREKVNDGREII